jgi:hypothetical protein
MRGGWVTQLCTFAYVVVWPEIVYEVEYQLEAEEIARAKSAAGPGGLKDERGERASGASTLGDHSQDESARDSSDLDSGSLTLRGYPQSTSYSQPRAADSSESDQSSSPSSSFNPDPASHSALASPSSTPDLRSHSSHPRYRPTPAEQAAEKARLDRLADRAARELAEKATAHSRKAPPEQTAHPSNNDAPHLAEISPVVILDAKKTTGKESLYLSAIGQRLRKGAAGKPRRDGGLDGKVGGVPSKERRERRDAGSDGRDTRDSKDWEERVTRAWPLFYRYFNGRSALERIALQEEMKRKDVWALLMAMSEYLLCVRHW